MYSPQIWTIGLVAAIFYGIAIGSFLNVVIWRVPQGQSVASPAWSYCPRCEHRLGSADLVPLFSFLLLGRKCRYCHNPISGRYFTVEAITGFAFTAVYLRFGFSWVTVFGCLFTALLVAIFFIDLDTFIIPDELNVMGWVLGVAANLLSIARLGSFDPNREQWARLAGWAVPNSMFAAAACAVLFHAISLLGYVYYTSKIGLPDPLRRTGRFLHGIVDDYGYLLAKYTGAALVIPSLRCYVAAHESAPEEAVAMTRQEIAEELENEEEQTGMGQGDAKLAGLIGAFLFLPQALVAFLAAFLAGALAGVGMILFQRKGGRTAIPFGPYLVVGAYVSLLFGSNVVQWYVNYAFAAK